MDNICKNTLQPLIIYLTTEVTR